MAGDRRAALIVQAAVKGVIDFSKFDPFDRRWWLRLSWILQGIENDNVRELLKIQHAQHLAGVDLQSTKNHWKIAASLITEVQRLYFPWDESLKAKDTTNQLDADRKVLHAEFGDPKSPEGAERIRRTLEYLRSYGKKQQTPSTRKRKRPSKDK